jgi:hypothetical protein
MLLDIKRRTNPTAAAFPTAVIASLVNRNPSPPPSNLRGNDEMSGVGGRSRLSSFDVSLIPKEKIHKRELHPWSVHYSMATASWIATIARGADNSSNMSSTGDDNNKRCTSFQFPTEREARKFAKVYSPPKMCTGATKCVCCSIEFTDPSLSADNVKQKECRSYNCRNCGAQICEKCSHRWGIRMLPKTYISGAVSSTVRVCKSCDWLSNAFCMSLLQGQYDNALLIHESGNLNLRCTFADIHKEAVFPIHCAVMGGNLDLVKWLVEVHDCPIAVRKDDKSGTLLSIQTSKRRTLIDLAMTGKPKIDILGFLVGKNLSVLDTKDPTLAPKTLQTLMSAGYRFERKDADGENSDIESHIFSHPSDSSVTTTIEDACMLCCEKQMDCVLSPCGHQICCLTCGSNLKECPICKNGCQVLKIFRL